MISSISLQRVVIWPSKNSSQRVHYSYSALESSLISRIDNLHRQRLSDFESELERLNSNVFVYKRLSKIKAIYKAKGMQFLDVHQIAYGRSLELFEKLKKDYYIFNHGQASSCMLGLTILHGVLLAQRRAKVLLPFQVALGEVSQFDDAKLKPTKWYKDNLKDKGKFIWQDNDHNHQDSLISSDAMLLSVAHTESALSFLNDVCYKGEDDGFKDVAVRDYLLEELACKLLPDDATQQSKFIEEFNVLDKLIIEADFSINSFGNLYSICIPKEKKFHEYGYFCKQCGIALEEQSDDNSSMLEKLQNSSDLSNDPDPIFPRKAQIPQVRLLRHKTLDDDVKVFAFPTRSDALFKSHVEQMQVLVAKYFSHLRPQSSME